MTVWKKKYSDSGEEAPPILLGDTTLNTNPGFLRNEVPTVPTSVLLRHKVINYNLANISAESAELWPICY